VFQRVLVGIDDTALSERLVEYAAAFARAFGARLSLLRAYDWSERMAMVEAPTIEVVTNAQPKEEAEARALLDRFAQPLRDEGLHVETVVVDDAAGDAILQESRREPETLVVLGAHDHGWLSRLVRGSTEHDVLNRFEMPVLIIREGA
jgi:nucleotide-binding universal stress UspA family protein